MQETMKTCLILQRQVACLRTYIRQIENLLDQALEVDMPELDEDKSAREDIVAG